MERIQQLKMRMTKNKWNSFTFQVQTAEGKAYIFIDEDSPGKIERVHVQIGKAGSSLNALCSSLAEMTTSKIKKDGLAEAIVSLSGTYSDRIAMHHGMPIRSVPEAIMYALMQYRSSIPEDPSIRRGPRFNRR